MAIRGYALTLVIAYWGDLPVTSRRFVFATWAVLAPASDTCGGTSCPSAGRPAATSFTYLATAMAIPCAVAMLLEPAVRGRRPTRFSRAAAAGSIVLAMLFATVPQSALDVTTSLHPYTMDLYALAWDRAAGLNFAQAQVREIDGVLGLSQFVVMGYRLVPLGRWRWPSQLSGRLRHVASSVLDLGRAVDRGDDGLPLHADHRSAPCPAPSASAAALTDGVPHAIQSIR